MTTAAPAPCPGLNAARTMIIDHLGETAPAAIEPDDLLIADLGCDSLDLVEFQMAIEELGLPAPDDAFLPHMRVRDLARMLAKDA